MQGITISLASLSHRERGQTLGLLRTDPAEAAVEKTERVEFGDLEFGVDLVTVDFAFEDEPFRRRTVEREARPPGFTAAFRQRDAVLINVHRGGVSRKGI